jgi:hypothetical protein
MFARQATSDGSTVDAEDKSLWAAAAVVFSAHATGMSRISM